MSGDEDKKRGKKEESYAHMYDIATERIQPRRSAITDALRREDEELANEAERLRLQELIGERRKKVDDMKTSQQPGQTPMASTNIVASLMAMLFAQGMNPAQVNEYIKALDNESILRLSMIGSQNMNALLPISMMMGGSKSGNSVQDAVATTKAILEVAKPTSGEDSMLTKLVTETIPNMQTQLSAARDLAYQNQIQGLQKQIEDIKPMDPAEYVKKVYDAATALGMKSGMDMSLEVKKLELEDAREVRRITADKENTQMIVGTVKDMIEGKVGDILGKIGDAGAERIRGGKGAPTQGGIPPSTSTERPQTLMVQCGKCGGTFTASSSSKTAKCPHCGSDLQLEFKPPTPEKKEDQTSRVPEFGGGSGDLAPRWLGPAERERSEG